MTNKRVLFFMMATTFFATSSWAQNKKKGAAKDSPKVAETPAVKGVVEFLYNKYDFGTINEKGGRVNHLFKFVNTGYGPVKLTDVVTTCGCTQTTWSTQSINPGDTGFVKVVFDPDGRQGKLDKVITVISDGSPKSQSLTIKGNVYPSRFNFANTYKYQYGNLAVISNMLNFPAVKHTKYDSTEIGFYNMSNKTIYVYRIDAPKNILVNKPYDYMPPNTGMQIKVKYYPDRPVEFGPVKHEIKIHTNDDSIPTKIFYVSANIVQDFGNLDKSAKKKAPKAVFNKTEIDLGNNSLFTTPVAKFTITNKGKQDLIIHKVIRTCNCLAPE
ncbi:MAG: DUF1573 domain-containing protein, partial [Bacteroidia bacterium]|nr:DUF1573 domain-containing protein [Bacteroidia bacterium]